MKRLLYILTAVALLLSASGCKKRDINGALDGFWRLSRIEHLDSTPIEEPVGSFWSFQRHICQLDISGTRMFASFEYGNNTLRIYRPCTQSKQTSAADNDEIIETLTDESEKAKYVGLLRSAGLFRFDTTFSILEINGDRMRLESPDARLIFVKY